MTTPDTASSDDVALTQFRVWQAHLGEAGALGDLHLDTALLAYRRHFPPEAPKPSRREVREQWRAWPEGDDLVRAVLVAEVGSGVVGVVVASANALDPRLGT